MILLSLEQAPKLGAKTKSEQPVLYNATRSGCDKAVRLLLDQGADIHEKHHFGNIALQHARKGNLQRISLLQDQGADIDA